MAREWQRDSNCDLDPGTGATTLSSATRSSLKALSGAGGAASSSRASAHRRPILPARKHSHNRLPCVAPAGKSEVEHGHAQCESVEGRVNRSRSRSGGGGDRHWYPGRRRSLWEASHSPNQRRRPIRWRLVWHVVFALKRFLTASSQGSKGAMASTNDTAKSCHHPRPVAMSRHQAARSRQNAVIRLSSLRCAPKRTYILPRPTAQRVPLHRSHPARMAIQQMLASGNRAKTRSHGSCFAMA